MGVGLPILFYSECGREAFRIFEGRGAYRLMEKTSSQNNVKPHEKKLKRK